MNESQKDKTKPVSLNSNPLLPNTNDRTTPVSVGGRGEPPLGTRPPAPNSFPEFVIQPPGPKKTKKPGRFWGRFFAVLGGILILVILGGAGGWMGYNKAVGDRLNAQDEQRIGIAVAQYQLGIVDLQAGRYEIARQRFEYVIRIDPSFPGAAQRLTESMLSMATITVPTAVPSPTVVPTPDTRNVDQKYASAVAQINAQDWDNAIDSLMALRKTDQTYKPEDVDGMLYMALRQRGVKKISSGALEEGIYDLALAERLAPLDHEADGYRAIARQYIIGVSFWAFDWGQVYDYFKQIAAGNPGMVDSTGMTAQKRFSYAAAKYADQIYATNDYCQARDYYSQSMQSGILNIGATATNAAYKCSPPTSAVTATPSATLSGATVAPTATTGGGPAPTETATTKPAVASETPTTKPEPPTETPSPKPPAASDTPAGTPPK